MVLLLKTLTIVSNLCYAIAKYGAVAFSYNVKNGYDWEYLLAESDENSAKGSAHASVIVGWDDNISKDNFTYYNGNKAKIDGAWIVRNSWGASSHNNGYFYLSYESILGHYLTAFNYANRSDYDNNYYWDVMNSGFFTSQYQDGAKNNDVAAIFPTLKASYNKKEYLKAINVTINGKNASLDVKVYKNLKNKNNPESGTLVFFNNQTIWKFRVLYNQIK